jgi:cell wall-associated NlpC family hydrolase
VPVHDQVRLVPRIEEPPVLPSDLTAIVFTNLLWFLLTLCLGSVLVTRMSRGQANEARPAAHRRDRAAAGSRTALGHGRPRITWSLASAGAAGDAGASDELAADEAFESRGAFRVSDYLVLSDYPVDDEDLEAEDGLAADDVVAPGGESTVPSPADAVVAEPLAPLPATVWHADTLPPRRSPVPAESGHAPARKAPGPARHRRPRPAPARGKVLAQVAAVAIGTVMAASGTGLGLHLASGGGHASAVPPGGLAADIIPGTMPPAITRPATTHVTTRAAVTRHPERRVGSRPVTPHARLEAARAKLAATLNMIGTLGHDPAARTRGRLLLPSLARTAGRLRIEITRIEHRLDAPARRAPAPPIRLTSVTRHALARGGRARRRPPVVRAPAGEAGRRAAAVAYAEAQLGKPYVWGGAGPYGFDCSGLVMMAWQAGGVDLPHFTGAQWADTYHITAAQLRPGDLVFSNGFGHVQLYVGHGEVIQAPYTGQVVSYAPLLPAAVDGYASVFPPGQPVPHRQHPGPSRRHPRRHTPRAHHHPRAHHRAPTHHRARNHHARSHRRTPGHDRTRGHHRTRPRHYPGRGHHRTRRHHRPYRHHRVGRHHRPCRHHRIRRRHPHCWHGRTWRPNHRAHCGQNFPWR